MTRDNATAIVEKSPTDAPIKVSVLVATYNHEQFISDCLDAIIAQKTKFSMEIIVHDDASTDATPEILKTYVDKYPEYISLICQSKNIFSTGQKVWPILHRAAKGEYIAYCDGDDIWLNRSKVELQVDFLEKNIDYSFSFHASVGITTNGFFDDAAAKSLNLDRDISVEELLSFNFGDSVLFGSMVHRNISTLLPPEFNLTPNGDMFIPALLGLFGSGKYLHAAGPLGYRNNPHGLFLSKSIDQKISAVLRTRLMILCYLLRIDDDSRSKIFVEKHLMPILRAWFHS